MTRIPASFGSGQVGQIQIGIANNSIQEERHQGYGVLSCKVREDLVEVQRLLPAVCRWRFHSAQQDLQPSCFRARDDLVQVVSHLRDRHVP